MHLDDAMSHDEALPTDYSQLGITRRGTWPPLDPFPPDFAPADSDEVPLGGLREVVMSRYPDAGDEASLAMYWGYLHGSEWELAGMTPELRAARLEIISRSLTPEARASARRVFERYMMLQVARQLGPDSHTSAKRAEQFQAGIANVGLELAKMEADQVPNFTISTDEADQTSDFVLAGMVGRLLKAARHGFREQYRKGKRITKADRERAVECESKHHRFMCETTASVDERPRPKDLAPPREVNFGTYNNLDDEYDTLEDTHECSEPAIDHRLCVQDAYRVATKECSLRDVKMMIEIEDGANQHEVASALDTSHDTVSHSIRKLRKLAFPRLGLKLKRLTKPQTRPRDERWAHKCLEELPQMLRALEAQLLAAQPEKRDPT
jgi:hypothetical protein